MGAFGGSNLRHFFLACACSPPFPNAPENMRAVLAADGTLKLAEDRPNQRWMARRNGSTAALHPTATWRTPFSRPISQAGSHLLRAAILSWPTRPKIHCRRRHCRPGRPPVGKGRRLGLVCPRVERGAGRSPRHLQQPRRRQLPATPPALQLLCQIRAGHRGARATSQGHGGVLGRPRPAHCLRCRLSKPTATTTSTPAKAPWPPAT